MPKTKVLVVNNDPTMLRFLNQELDNSEYDIVSTRYNKDEVRNVLGEVAPDLIIIDIMMPSLDGISVCLYIRQWSQTPIMMLSTWGAEEGQVRGLDLSSDSYLTEPFGSNAFKVKIKETLWRTKVAANQTTNYRISIQ